MKDDEVQFDQPRDAYRYTVRPEAKAVGLGDLRMHELRHTFATLVLESGAFDMFTLSRLMGHSSITITNRVYADLRRKDYSAQRAAFSALVTGASAPSAPLARIA